jgi:hypothetical protein
MSLKDVEIEGRRDYPHKGGENVTKRKSPKKK